MAMEKKKAKKKLEGKSRIPQRRADKFWKFAYKCGKFAYSSSTHS